MKEEGRRKKEFVRGLQDVDSDRSAEERSRRTPNSRINRMVLVIGHLSKKITKFLIDREHT
ncbi:MAG: hypothetical protein KME60_31215 [Cyanomargarita calcarea GSE-NOS-MK-12-04C]|jgi:hypothetical protein|uniref:Uncharacterized protein n=1 Tax=Cyanomargarita calcarea GSE-NOS-MK-12-04C TaxID=2839659 RepID=A0A951UW29_9CYAN|nr:hypothetical protein [Cyanomargarita calcarea GSE-NOS-MK-12-04C]